VKSKLRFVFVIALTIAMGGGVVRGTEEQQETFGDKLKKLFVRPTPTPKPRKKKRVSPTPTVTAAENETPAPSLTETPLPVVTPSPSVSATATAQPIETPPPSPSAAETRTPTRAEEGQTQYFEAVRPISPGPRTRRSPSPRIILAPKTTPVPTTTATPTIESPVETPTPTETPVSRPMPSLPPMITRAPSPSSSPVTKKAESPNATIPVTEISDSKSYSPEVKKVIDLGLSLTTQNLGYKVNSADPAGRGMDSSGFVYYVLSQGGIKDVPRDAREQYIWVRKAGNFQAVLAQRDDTFELDALKPGDLLFWASSYGVSRDPDITQTMIYLGREKGTNQRIMIGASERLAYKGQSRSGVNVFDFKVERAKSKSNTEPGPVFVGYGRIPGPDGK
jgi:cell wall-associated NlpC family hydrolase